MQVRLKRICLSCFIIAVILSCLKIYCDTDHQGENLDNWIGEFRYKEMGHSENGTEIDFSESQQQELTFNMPMVEVYDSGDLSVEIQSQEEYAAWVSQLGNYRSSYKLYMDMNETDVIIYLDELLAFGNFKTLKINDGGIISAKDISAVNMDMLERIEFYRIHSIDEGLISHIPRQTKLWIDMDGHYKGTSPELELLLGTDCQNIMMVQRQDKGVETSVLMNEQNALESKLKEWDILRTVLIEEQRILCGYCMQVSGGYSYTEYEFCGSDTEDITKAYICIKDQEGHGGQYFDVISIPEERLDGVRHVNWSRILLEDMNFDGYTDIIFVGQNDGGPRDCVYYLWKESEKQYEMEATLPTRKLVNIDEARKRLTYTESASAFDDTYYIYEYDGERFKEKKLWVVIGYLEQEQKNSVTWQYYEDGQLIKKLELVSYGNEEVHHIAYEENGESTEELQIDGKVYFPDIGQKYFSEFDFYNAG